MKDDILEQMKRLQSVDPLKPQGEVSMEDMGSEFSPMNPPDAFSPPSSEKIPYEDMHPFLQKLTDEHVELKTLIENFDLALKKLKAKEPQTPELQKSVEDFFHHFDGEFHAHNRKEERALFPVLHDYLLKSGEHSPTEIPVTGINLLEDEHVEIARLVTMSLQLFQLSQSPFEQETKEKLFDMAILKGFDLIEVLNLHIFREDEIIFGLAQNLMTSDDLDKIANITH